VDIKSFVMKIHCPCIKINSVFVDKDAIKFAVEIDAGKDPEPAPNFHAQYDDEAFCTLFNRAIDDP